MNLRRKLYGWKESSPELYELSFKKYGGSVNMHPKVINVISSIMNLDVDYYHKEIDGEVISSYALVGNKTIGIECWKDYPVSYDEVIIPSVKGSCIFFPEKTKKLSSYNQGCFANSSFRISRKSKICIARENYSSKTEKNRRNEYNRFERAGGVCYDLNQFTADELTDYYIFLFTSRFAGEVKCYNRDEIKAIFVNLWDLIFGHILFVNGIPCAMDIVLMAESDDLIYLDVPNGGVNVEFSHLSPGSLLMWNNIKSAHEYGRITGKKIRMSIGGLSDDWSYKLRWSEAESTGRVFF